MSLHRFNRWQAAPIHLGISAVIALFVLLAMLFVWYPQPYFVAAGGLTLLLLIIGVDVVVGPLLTLLVYDPKKGDKLKIDLAVIVGLQLAALIYGAGVMFNARPVYLAFAGDRFELVEANAIDDADLALAAPAFRTLPLTGPKLVGTRLPSDVGAREKLGQVVFMGGTIGQFPQHYVAYSSVVRDVLSRAQPMSALRREHPAQAKDVDAWIAASGRPEETLRFLPLQARHGDMAVIVDATGKVVGMLAIDPW
jgi:hypothetical protein